MSVSPEEFRERIAGQLATAALFVCESCWPTLAVDPVPGRWRLIVDHSEGCPRYADLLVHGELARETSAADEQLARELELDRPPSREELARWAAEDADEDPPGQEG